MNYIHNTKSGKFEPKGRSRHYTVPWHMGLLILSGIVLVIVAMGAHNADADNSYAPVEIPVSALAPQKKSLLTAEEIAQVRARQDLILKEAEALKAKKGLEAELAKVESELSATRKASLNFQ